MVEYWNWIEGYKFYSDEETILELLKKVTGAKPHGRYYRNGVLEAEDIIIPEKMLGRAKKISGEKLLYIE